MPSIGLCRSHRYTSKNVWSTSPDETVTLRSTNIKSPLPFTEQFHSTPDVLNKKSVQQNFLENGQTSRNNGYIHWNQNRAPVQRHLFGNYTDRTDNSMSVEGSPTTASAYDQFMSMPPISNARHSSEHCSISSFASHSSRHSSDTDSFLELQSIANNVERSNRFSPPTFDIPLPPKHTDFGSTDSAFEPFVSSKVSSDHLHHSSPAVPTASLIKVANRLLESQSNSSLSHHIDSVTGLKCDTGHDRISLPQYHSPEMLDLFPGKNVFVGRNENVPINRKLVFSTASPNVEVSTQGTSTIAASKNDGRYVTLKSVAQPINKPLRILTSTSTVSPCSSMSGSSVGTPMSTPSSVTDSISSLSSIDRQIDVNNSLAHNKQVPNGVKILQNIQSLSSKQELHHGVTMQQHPAPLIYSPVETQRLISNPPPFTNTIPILEAPQTVPLQQPPPALNSIPPELLLPSYGYDNKHVEHMLPGMSSIHRQLLKYPPRLPVVLPPGTVLGPQGVQTKDGHPGVEFFAVDPYGHMIPVCTDLVYEVPPGYLYGYHPYLQQIRQHR